MKYILYKIKEGKIDQWKDWVNKLNTIFNNELIKTLKEEDALLEGFLIFELNKVFYTVGFTQEKKGGLKPFNPNNSLNLEHNRIKKDSLELISKDQIGSYLGLNL